MKKIYLILIITLFLTGGDVGFFKLAYLLGSKLGNVNKIIIILINIWKKKKTKEPIMKL